MPYDPLAVSEAAQCRRGTTPGPSLRQCAWCSCMTAWPRPRAISQRFTGTVSAKAMTRLRARLHQKSPSPRPAAIAPGTSRMKALSTISIVVIETVSAAKATPAARRKPIPARSSGRIVSA